MNKISEKKIVVISVFWRNNCSSFDFTNLYLFVGLYIIIVINTSNRLITKLKKSNKIIFYNFILIFIIIAIEYNK